MAVNRSSTREKSYSANSHQVSVTYGETSMDKWAFGFTMMVIGVGGTFLTLAILIWTVQILKKIFPLSAEGRPDKA